MSAALAAAAGGVAPLLRALCSAGSPAAVLAAAAPLVRRLSTAVGRGDAAASAGEEAPVLIAGGGPTGLTTALLLAKYGVRSVVLEKSK